MSNTLPGLVLTISLAISLATVAQWRVADREIVSRLGPRWRAAAMNLELTAVVIILATGAAVAYVILKSADTGKPLSAADRRSLFAALGWQAWWLVVSAIVPRVAALLPDRTRATAFNVLATLGAAFLAVFVGLVAAVPILGAPPSHQVLLATVLPTAVLSGVVGWFFSGVPGRPPVEARLRDDRLELVNTSYLYGGELVEVSLWRDGSEFFITPADLDDAAFQHRRLRREQRHRGRAMSHGPRLVFAAPRLEPPVVRTGPVTWRDRTVPRALVLMVRRRPLAPDGQEHHLVPHPQYINVWQWPSTFEVEHDAAAAAS
jgi:hypothetical protein